MDLSGLGVSSVDGKEKEPEPEVVVEKDHYCIGDWILSQTDADSDQRFWVAQIMNITRAYNLPDVDYEDPVSIPSAPLWLKVWWSVAEKEFGVYKREYHYVQSGARIRTLSWIPVDDVITTLKGGLNCNNTIKNYKSYRKGLEYDIRAACGQ